MDANVGIFGRIADTARIYGRFIGVSVRGQMQYKASFWMLSLSQLLVTGIEFLGLWALFARFGGIRGWSLADIALFYGLVNVAFALADGFGRGFDTFANMVKSGDFDRLLLRPRSLALQVGSQDLLLTRVGRLAQGAAVLGWSLHTLPIAWSVVKVVFLVATIVGGAAMFYAVLVLQATLSFWTVESLELMNILTYGGTMTAQYPLTIYHPGFRAFFTFVLPLACLNIIPVRVLLSASPTGLAWLAPLAGFALLTVSLQIWRVGVRRYASTGS